MKMIFLSFLSYTFVVPFCTFHVLLVSLLDFMHGHHHCQHTRQAQFPKYFLSFWNRSDLFGWIRYFCNISHLYISITLRYLVWVFRRAEFSWKYFCFIFMLTVFHKEIVLMMAKKYIHIYENNEYAHNVALLLFNTVEDEMKNGFGEWNKKILNIILTIIIITRTAHHGWK